jgi:hypothetical protein
VFAIFNFGADEMTILLAFGGLVLVPLIVGLAAFSLDYRANHRN